MLNALVLGLRVLFAVITPASDADAEAIHRLAPQEITVDQAKEHIWAANVAAMMFSVDDNMVLGLGYHESRWHSNVDAPDRSGRGCGVMTPTPQNACVKKTLLAQYIEGVHHWRVDWGTAKDVRGVPLDDREMLIGVAGGYYAIYRCRQGPVLRYGDHGDDLCKTPEVFWGLRDLIANARRTRATI